MIRFKCVYCGQRILAPEDGADKKGKCPKCEHILVVPETTKGRPAISPNKEPMPEHPKKYVPAWDKGPKPWGYVTDEEADALTELCKESFGFLIPTYDKLSLFLMAVTWVLLFIINHELNKTIQNFLLARNWPLIIYVSAVPAIFLIVGIYQIFIKREKSDIEKTIMLWFAIVTNVLTGIIAAVYIIQNADVRNWQIIFPMWNLINAVILYLMLAADVIDEDCIIYREVKPAQVIFGIIVAVMIILVCNYVLKLHWSITFSICIVYTTSFDRALQNVLPGLMCREDEQE